MHYGVPDCHVRSRGDRLLARRCLAETLKTDYDYFNPDLNHDILLNNGSGTKRLLFA